MIQDYRYDQGAMEDSSSAIVRAAAFAWLRQRLVRPDDTLSRAALAQGFECQGERICLVGPQGIFKPAQIKHYPLSITTTTNGPYEDAFDAGGQYLLYSYRGTDPNFHENRRLRDAMQDKVPLIYFFGTVPGQYLAVAPVYIVGDDPGKLRFTVAADDFLILEYERDDTDDEIRRGYVTRQVRQRIHQRSFRDRVLRAYQERCSVCRLKHARLLDAAHITPDTDEGSEPVVSNGLSLCKIHHAAFDGEYFGIRPDYRIVVRPDIMEERDGPMLKHGLQEIHETKIVVPGRAANRPDPDRLKRRFGSFAESARL